MASIKIIMLICFVVLIFNTRQGFGQAANKKLTTLKLTTTTKSTTLKSSTTQQPIPIGNMRYNPKSIVFQFWQKTSKSAVPVTTSNFSSAPFTPTLETKVLVHGFMSSPKKAGFLTAVQKYQRAGSYNMILVDWSAESSKNLLGYPEARLDTEWVGDWLAFLLLALKDKGGNLGKMHCIGHSLGTHVCNSAALQVSNQTGLQLGRITGLDPANPFFESVWAGMRGHALFTDVIHTTMLLSRNVDFGDADFYPNDGHNQPGCPIIGSDTCDHGRATEFFLESISSKNFVARNCDSWLTYVLGGCAKRTTAIMGELCSNSTKGKFFLGTKSSSPYAKGL